MLQDRAANRIGATLRGVVYPSHCSARRPLQACYSPQKEGALRLGVR